VTLREIIAQEIRERGPIPFSRYMELCLYEPDLGYYSRNANQFGKAGDFYTSSDVHGVFGRLLARQVEQMWRLLGVPAGIEIMELGPGRGLFAQDVLAWAKAKFPQFFEALHYSLCEKSPALRSRLQETLKEPISTGKCSLCELSPLGRLFRRSLATEIPVIVFANEFFDALPVEVMSDQGKLCVGEEGGRLVETWVAASAEELEFLDRYGVHPENGERVEAPIIAQRYMADIAGSVERGFLCAIDYGYTRGELLEGRHRGTIATYRQHSFSTNPYEAPGEQDITAHVNFTALVDAAQEHGMMVQPLVTQSQFLMGIGEANQFADAFEECRLPQERAKVALQLKHLISPEAMGETFHVLVASKGLDSQKASQLSGLTFGKR
jgi:SAM-dependent MidA family methyltransferase